MSLQRLAVCLAVWLYAAPGHAASLRWIAPADCPSQAAIETRIEQSIGRPLREVYGVDFEATIVQAGPHKWALTLRTQARTPAGEARARELSAQSCSEVSDAAALAITLTISERTAAGSDGREDSMQPDESADASEQRASADPDAPPGRPPSATVTEDSEEAQPSAAAPIGLEFSISLGFVLDTAILPSVAAGGGLEFAMRYGSLKAIALGALFADQDTRLKDGRGGRFGLALGGGLLCLQPSAEAVWMLGCAGFEIGKVSAEGILASPLHGSATLKAVRLEVGGGYRLSPRVAAFVRLGASIPVATADFTVDRGVPVHHLGSVSGRALAGIELAL